MNRPGLGEPHLVRALIVAAAGAGSALLLGLGRALWPGRVIEAGDDALADLGDDDA